MTNEMIADPRNKRDPERGAALVFAMGVMILVGLISAGVLGFVATGVRQPPRETMHRIFRPDRPVLSAQAEGLGTRTIWQFDPERVVRFRAGVVERPLQGR